MSIANMSRRRLLGAALALPLFASARTAVAKKKEHHKGGEKLLGHKIKTNGKHEIDKHGKHTVSADVVNGKVAGVHVKHAEKGDVPVKKYKTNKKMAQAEAFSFAAYVPVQFQDLGTTYIGYAFIDEYGDEVIYWFPYQMVLDGDTGAVTYVPLT
jgi:hypothetical protein